MFGIDLESLGTVITLLIVMAFGWACIYPNQLRKDGTVERPEPEPIEGVSRMRIQTDIVSFLSDEPQTASAIISALPRHQLEDVSATLFDMFTRGLLLEELHEERGYVYSVKS